MQTNYLRSILPVGRGAGTASCCRWRKGADLRRGVRGAKLVIVPGCGHTASIEKPKTFLAAVLQFLD